MIVVRRLYLLLVSAISLQSVAWASIALLRGLFTPGVVHPKTAVALETAVILVGLPLFIVHWWWARRLAQDEEERASGLRRLYLVGMTAGFAAPLAESGFRFFHIAFSRMLDVALPAYTEYAVDTLPAAAVHFPVAMLVLALGVAAMQMLLRRDMQAQSAPETPVQGTLRRLYVFGFSGAGLVLTAVALVPLLRWLLFQVGPPPIDEPLEPADVALALAQLPIGLTLWLSFWTWAQRLFATGQKAELTSTLRKIYLYAAVFVSTAGVVFCTTLILAGTFAMLLDVPFNDDVRRMVSPLVVLGVVWAYHAWQIRVDARRHAEVPQQTGIRRLYQHLVAGVGLLALLIGVGGLVGVFFFVVDGEPFVGDLRQALAWFAAAAIAGLPVWLLPWRQIQQAAMQKNGGGEAARQSLVRKIYLYLYIFLATMTVLATAVYIVSQLVELLLAARDTAHLLRDLGMAVAYASIGVGIWVYHGLALRRDGRLAAQAQRARLAQMRVILLTTAQPEVMASLGQLLHQKLPDVQLQMVPQPGAEDAAAGEMIPERVLGEADVIISPVALRPHNGQAALAAAAARSPARKLLLPVCTADCVWLGVTERDIETVSKRAARAIEQVAAGAEIDPGRRFGIDWSL